jgi:hypothetical protein
VPNVLQAACASADAVVIGTVEPVSLAAPPAQFTLTVDSVIKGDLGSAIALLVSWPGSLISARVAPEHYRALWFLQKNGSGNWQILPLGGPNAPLYASGLAVRQGGQSDSAPTSGGCYGAVWTVLKENATSIDESPMSFTALETLLQGSPEAMVRALPAIDATIEAYTQSRSVSLRALALAFKIRAQRVEALEQLATQIETLAKSAAGYQLVLALATWRGAEPAGIAALGAISGTSDAGALGRAAAEALMMIHTRDAVPFLAKLLTRGDPQSLEVAVRGLSLFVRGAPILTPEKVRAMAYFTEAENREFLDSSIAPYVTVTRIPSGREIDYRDAWIAWWARVSGKWVAEKQK